MSTITELKQKDTGETPLLIFDCQSADGAWHRWSTHRVTFEGNPYEGRILKHNLFEIRSSADEAIDGVARLTITLSNVDTTLTQVERSTGWKGAKLMVRFLFVDLGTGNANSETLVLFRGAANAPEDLGENTIRLSFSSRLNLQRIMLPETRIQKRCPWMFPATSQQRQEALGGATRGKYSNLWRCAYSADLGGGCGNLNGATPFDACDYTRAQCVERGMFSTDQSGQRTATFGGIEFVPSTIAVRTYGDKSAHLSALIDNQARYNDVVPLVYGTVWYEPPLVFARNDGNLTHLEVLLGEGEMQGVLKVIVNNIEIPAGRTGSNMTGTGWYNIITSGGRSGSPSLDFTDSAGKPLGDPYGSMAALSVVVPNRINDGQSAPKVQVLAQGLKLPRYDASGNYVDEVFTSNPAWVLLDLLRRSGWTPDEIAAETFASAAAFCDVTATVLDANGNSCQVPRYQCNLALTRRRSAGDAIRGVRNASNSFLTYGADGKLELHAEAGIADQQSTKPAGSNSASPLAGGWPAYEFGDGSAGPGDIARASNDSSTLRLWSKNTADTPNRYSIEFQDSLNGYQQDSLSLVDVEDALRTGQESSVAATALGVPTFDQAGRVLALQLYKSIRGNSFIEFETSVRGIGLKPGDLITLTYQRAGFERQLFRILRLAPALNARTLKITAQIHDEAWYVAVNSRTFGGTLQPCFDVGVPRPLRGKLLDASGTLQYAISESAVSTSDGSASVRLTVDYSASAKPAVSQTGVPLLSLSPDIDTTNGGLPGGSIYYYGISSLDASGAEGELSFLVCAVLPAANDTNSVTLKGLSFPAGASGFRVYRGPDSQRLGRIGESGQLATSFTDGGLADGVAGPADRNFDHANFYWRFELQPPIQVSTYSATTVGNTTLQMPANHYAGAMVRLCEGAGEGQERPILSNDGTTLTVLGPWNPIPDSTTKFAIAEAGWVLGASGQTSPLTFQIPNRGGTTVEILGRSANSYGIECAAELSPLTRWQIAGGDGQGQTGDADVPPAPTFSLTTEGAGRIAVSGIGFPTLENTRTIAAGTLRLFYCDELAGAPKSSLESELASTDTVVTIAGSRGFAPGDLVQVDAELIAVIAAQDATTYQVSRGEHGSVVADHDAGAAVYPLVTITTVLAFPREFFGSTAGGDYSYCITLPDAKVAAADLFMTNSRGNSAPTNKSFTATTDRGLRTLSGGQISMQVDGTLATQTDAAAPLTVSDSHAIRDVFATVLRAPTGAPLVLRLRLDGAPLCELTIPTGSTASNTVDGLALAPLKAMSQLAMDVVSVGREPDDEPGSDLTVTIRL